MKTTMSLVQYLGVGTLALGILAGCSKKVEMPTVVGLDLDAATAKLKEMGLVVGQVDPEAGGRETAPGTVLRQEPVAGQPLDKGAAVHLVIVVASAKKGGVDLDKAIETVEKGVNTVTGGVDKAVGTATGVVEKANGVVGQGKDLYDKTKEIIEKNKPAPKPERKPAANAEPRTPAPPKDPVRTSRLWLHSFEPASPAEFASKRMIRVRFGYESAETGAVRVTVIPMHKGSPVQTDPHPVTHIFPGTGDKGLIHFSLKQIAPIDEVRLELRSVQNPAVLLCESRKSINFKPVDHHGTGDAKDRTGKGPVPALPKGGVVLR